MVSILFTKDIIKLQNSISVVDVPPQVTDELKSDKKFMEESFLERPLSTVTTSGPVSTTLCWKATARKVLQYVWSLTLLY